MNKKVPTSVATIKKFKINKLENINCKRNTKFQAASISKVIASILTLKLVQEGQLNLNKNVNEYLKDFKVINRKGKETKVTLKQLLSHKAGINVHGFPGYSINAKIPTLIQILEGEVPCNTERIVVDNKPDKKFCYSGGGFTLIQKIIEDSTGKKYQGLVENKIFNPLKMHNSDFKLKKIRNTKRYPEKAAAGLWSTPEDLSKLLIEIQLSYLGKSNKILSKKVTRKMVRPTKTGDGDFVGLGIFITKDKKRFFHEGHNHKFLSALIGSIKNGDGIVAMIHSDNEKILDNILEKYHLSKED